MLRHSSTCFFRELLQETLHNANTPILIDGRPVCNLRFADDMEDSNYKLKDLTNPPQKKPGAYEMELNREKSSVMLNSTSNTEASVIMVGEPLGTFNFEILGSNPAKRWHLQRKNLTLISTATTAKTRLERI